MNRCPDLGNITRKVPRSCICGITVPAICLEMQNIITVQIVNSFTALLQYRLYFLGRRFGHKIGFRQYRQALPTLSDSGRVLSKFHKLYLLLSPRRELKKITASEACTNSSTPLFRTKITSERTI